SGSQDVDQAADRESPVGRRGNAPPAVHAIAVAPALARGADVAVRAQLGEYALYRALLDPDLMRDLRDAHVRVARDAQQHLAVIGKEAPAAVLPGARHSDRTSPPG